MAVGLLVMSEAQVSLQTAFISCVFSVTIVRVRELHNGRVMRTCRIVDHLCCLVHRYLFSMFVSCYE